MIEAFESGGVLMWPLLMIGVGILVLTMRCAWLLSLGPARVADAEGTLQSILFWSMVAVVLGLLGTIVGIVVTAQAISSVGGEVGTGILWGGLALSLVTTIFGLVILLVGLVSWFALRQWQLRLRPGTTASLA